MAMFFPLKIVVFLYRFGIWGLPQPLWAAVTKTPQTGWLSRQTLEGGDPRSQTGETCFWAQARSDIRART